MKLKFDDFGSGIPNNQAFTSTLHEKYLKIRFSGALIPNEGSAVMATAMSDHNSLLLEELNTYSAMKTLSKTIPPHRKLPNKEEQGDTACRSELARQSVYSEVDVRHDRSNGRARRERAKRNMGLYVHRNH